jgi:periplasmic protein TonB
MTNNELLNASLIDIVFDGRNKEYGAYELRKEYSRRLLIALGTGILLILFFILLNAFTEKEKVITKTTDGSPLVVRTVEVMPEEKKLPKKAVQPKPATTKPVATVAFPPIKIVPNEEADEKPVPSQQELEGKQTGLKDIEGDPADGTVVNTSTTLPVGNETSGEEVKTEPPFLPEQAQPEFPGGPEALMRFLSRHLNTPEELESGQKKMVRARFKVDRDGTISLVEIEQSAGNSFDKEVIRVCKKMPRWKPAVQNGVPVPISYVLPVTFLGIDQ